MIGFFIFCIIVLIFFLQRYWAAYSLENISFESEVDNKLVEPEEVITLIGKLQNNSKLPVFYARKLEHFPVSFKIEEDERWIKSHASIDFFNTSIDYRFYLMGKTRHISKIRFSIPKRGTYQIGRTTIGTGDFLGFETKTKHLENVHEIVVIPRKTKDLKAIKTLGGFLGDISVRRFILEDPVLITGYNEYTGREPFKNISWKQTAKAGRLQVKEFDHTTDTNVIVILNVDGEKKYLEECLEYTRTVCEELELKHIPYEFFTNTDFRTPLGIRQKISEGLGKQHLNSILYGLGRTTCTRLLSFNRLVDLCSEEKKMNASYILITPYLDAKQKLQIQKLQRISDTKVCVLTPQVDLADNKEAIL